MLLSKLPVDWRDAAPIAWDDLSEKKELADEQANDLRRKCR